MGILDDLKVDTIETPKKGVLDDLDLSPITSDQPLVDPVAASFNAQYDGLVDQKQRPGLLARGFGSMWNSLFADTATAYRTETNLGKATLETKQMKTAEQELQEQITNRQPVSRKDLESYASSTNKFGWPLGKKGDPIYPWAVEGLALMNSGELPELVETTDEYAERHRTRDTQVEARRIKDIHNETGYVDLPKSEGFAEALVGGGGHLAGMLGQLAVTKRIVPNASSSVQFGLQNELSGGNFLEGYLTGKVLGAVNKAKLPGISEMKPSAAKAVLDQAAKVGIEGTMFGTMTAAGGGSKEEVVASALLPAFMRGVGVTKAVVMNEVLKRTSVRSSQQAIIDQFMNEELAKMSPEERVDVMTKLANAAAKKTGKEVSSPSSDTAGASKPPAVLEKVQFAGTPLIQGENYVEFTEGGSMSVRYHPEMKMFYVGSFDVYEPNQGKGIGTKYLNELKALADKNGFTIDVEVIGNNGTDSKNAVRLYKYYKDRGFVGDEDAPDTQTRLLTYTPKQQETPAPNPDPTQASVKSFLKQSFPTAETGKNTAVSLLQKSIIKDTVLQEQQMRLDPTQRARIKGLLFGKTSVAELSIDELVKYQNQLKDLTLKFSNPTEHLNVWKKESGVTDAEVGTLLKNGEKDVLRVSNTLKSRAENGGYATDPEIRREQVNRDARWIRAQTAHAKQVGQLANVGKTAPDLTSWWQNARYQAADMQDKTGMPIYDTIENIIYNSTLAEAKVMKDVMGIFHSTTPYTKDKFNSWNIIFKDMNSTKINEAMTEVNQLRSMSENKSLSMDQVLAQSDKFKGLTDPQKDVMIKISKLLSNEFNASVLRETRFFNWSQVEDELARAITPQERTAAKEKWKRLVPIDVQKLTPESRKQLLADGRASMANGKHEEWIKSQDFGTQDFYSFADAPTMDLSLNAIQTDNFSTELFGTRPLETINLRGEYTRTANKGPSQAPPIQSVVSHLKRTYAKKAIQADFFKLQQMLKQAQATTKDVSRINDYLWQIVHGPQQAEGWAKIATKVNVGFWTMFATQPSRLAYFTLRNVLQPAIALGQLSPARSLQSISRLAASGRNEFLKQELAEGGRWDAVSEKNAYKTDYLLLEKTGLQNPQTRLGRMGAYAKLALSYPQELLSMSDEISRKMVFPIAHQAAFDVANEYKKGKIDYRTVRKELRMDTLIPQQTDKLERFLREGNVKDFAFFYGSYKTENTLLRYHLAHRSIEEQTPGGRTLAGLMVYPRGMFDIYSRNVWNPLKRGLVERNATTLYQGVMAVLGTYVGLRLANELNKNISGRQDAGDYSLLGDIAGYRPGSVGYSVMIDAMDDMQKSVNDTIKRHNGWSMKAVDEIMAGPGSKYGVEMWMPFIDTQIALYDNLHDAQGVSFYQALRASTDKRYMAQYGKRYTYNRTDLEKVQRMLFGGAKYKNDQKDWKRMSDKERATLILTGIRPRR